MKTLMVAIAVLALGAGAQSKDPLATTRKSRSLPVQALSTATCGSTSIALNSEEPTCNSHNGRWISTSETGDGNPAYWTPTALVHSTFNYYDGVVGLPDGGTYLITTEVPVASDCGVSVTAKLKINSTVVDSQTSPGGNRILRHRFVYVKQDPESVTDEIRVTLESVGGYGYAQGVVLDIQRTDVN